MEKKLKIIVANPSGNITIFVMTPCDKANYQKITEAILSQTDYEAEQVAFVLKDYPNNVDGAINMSGMEFCGNASRSFGLLLATNSDKNEFTIAISGATEPIKTIADPITGFAEVNMPLPKSISTYPKYDGTLVDMEGIVHLVVDINKHSPDSFESIRDDYYKDNNPPAFGVMYYDFKKKLHDPCSLRKRCKYGIS
jgi:diaminopimelate epimerase